MARCGLIERIAEPVKPGYSVLRETLWVDGTQVYSVVLGSPAPTASVQRCECTITLPARRPR